MKSVALILDPAFGAGVEDIACEMPVWIISSPMNDAAVGEIRHKLKGEVDVTSFFPRQLDDKAATCARALYDIDEHHGPCSSLHPYKELRIFGLSHADLPSRVMEQLGLVTAGPAGNELILRKRPAIRGAAQ